ncbi:MAG: 4-hydroxy-tetrahydrodipicolinate reductase [Firmicutes bacterium]|nr:4-hydroxy-tetrahydrodipicolinate reductase [Bacillota bacterium]
MKIILHGSTGAMGKAVAEIVSGGKHEIVAFVSPDYPQSSGNQYRSLPEFTGEADCIIDFSNHAAAKALTSYAAERRIPVVIATTGYTEEESAMVRECAKTVPVFMSANMSLGVAVLTKLAKTAAAFFPDADIEIVEYHHNRKLDAPSGTALMLGNAIKEVRPDAEFVLGRSGSGKRQPQDIGISAVRLGNEVGTHEIYIATKSQRIKLEHRAESRSLFAEGAVSAAEFLIKQAPGFYDMSSLVSA